MKPFYLVVLFVFLVACGPSYRDIQRQEMMQSQLEAETKQESSTDLGQLRQAGKYSEELHEQCKSETDLLWETFNSTSTNFRDTCLKGNLLSRVDFCFGKTDELLTQTGVEVRNFGELCHNSRTELLDKEEFTDEDITDVHGELSKELSTKAQEARDRIINFLETPSPNLIMTTSKVVRVIDGDTLVLETGETTSF